ncbi:hypothetical protein [Roseospira goensis]|uniref:Uncharacterized protein n=1 Tax=Roseospira goensis TaxID=391922 RepID=A0A7W6WL45_9PROT|nr:hypothetical protein [Roseospira goensis]MBB4286755.1 hypothetical protein [Roseospira goensis]
MLGLSRKLKLDNKEALEVSLKFPKIRKNIEQYMDGSEAGDDIITRIGLGLYGILCDSRHRLIRDMPEHCLENYIIYVKPSVLRKESSIYMKEAQKNWGRNDVNHKLIGFSQILASFYFASQSWEWHRETPHDSREFESSPGYQRAVIESFVQSVLEKSGKNIP